MNRIQYTLSPSKPESQVFELSLFIEKPLPHQVLMMPSWIPGSYMIRDFARHLSRISAHTPSGPLKIDQVDKNHWHCAPGDESLTVTYQVFANDLVPRGAYLDQEQGFLNGARIFMLPVNLSHLTLDLEIRAPESLKFADWHLATSLKACEINQNGFGLYQAAHYEDLIDHPIQMGCFEKLSISTSHVPINLIITGYSRCDEARLLQDLAKICHYYHELFEEIPHKDYYFFLNTSSKSAGGLEHKNASVLHARKNQLPKLYSVKPSDEYISLLSLASHEYFHLWHVKRIKPQALVDPELSSEAYTRQLWIFEGITAYYDELSLVRTGLITVHEYLKLLSKNIQRYLNTPGRLVQTLSDASLEAWTKFYQADENTPNIAISYYLKGALVALYLDLYLRKQTQNACNLDEVMRQLWRQYGKVGFGLPEGGFEALVEQLSQLELGPFFHHCLATTAELPFAEIFSELGLQIHYLDESRPNLGLKFRAGSDLVIHTIKEDSAAQQAGLIPEDHIIAINGFKVNHHTLDEILDLYQIGERVRVHAFRRDELKSFDLLLVKPNTTVAIEIDKEAESGALEALRAWLHQSA